MSDPVEEQRLRRAAALIGQAVAASPGVAHPARYAAGTARTILLGSDPTQRDRIRALLAEGRSPEWIAEHWLSQQALELSDPAAPTPEELAERARRREAETAAVITASRACRRDDQAGLAAISQLRSQLGTVR